jgi:DNA-binding NtrC family response regulator
MPRGRVLVADDEPSLLLTYTLILQKHGYEVSTASNSDDASLQLQQVHFDLLICDLTLKQDRDGCDLIESAMKSYPSMQIILMTGSSTPEVITWAKQQGIVILFKPTEVKTLLQVVSDSIGSH